MENKKVSDKADGRGKDVRDKDVSRGKDGCRGKDVKDKDDRDKDIRGKDVKGKDVRGKDVRGKDVKGKNVRGKDVKDKDDRGKDIRGKDSKNKDDRDKDIRGKDIRDKDVKGKNVRGIDGKDKDIRDKDGCNHRGNAFSRMKESGSAGKRKEINKGRSGNGRLAGKNASTEQKSDSKAPWKDASSVKDRKMSQDYRNMGQEDSKGSTDEEQMKSKAGRTVTQSGQVYRGKGRPAKEVKSSNRKDYNLVNGRSDKNSQGRGGADFKTDIKSPNIKSTNRKEIGKAFETATRKSPCPVSKKCGGCRWIHKPYEEQLKQKERWVRELLAPYCTTDPIIGMEDPAHYRNKVHAVFGEDKKHNPISGIYEEGTHYIVLVDSCLIENRKADEIIVSIRSLLKSFKIKPYNEDTEYGLLRHVLVRIGHVTGEIMVVLVLGSPVMPSKNNFVKALLKLHPEITTIVVNINNRPTTMVLGDKEQVIYGKGHIEDELCGMTFRISPKSFYQVNSVQAERLYQKAIEYAGLTGKEVVVDAYCGTGTIGMIASTQAKKVIGVELNGDAVRDARDNAKRNGVKNIQFYQNDAGKFLVEMAEQQAAVDLVLMDPPRSGSDEAFLGAVAKLRPAKIVYISCNPETLVRDLKYLKKSGYEVKKGGAVDMFPFTDHVEVVIQMTFCSRKEK